MSSIMLLTGAWVIFRKNGFIQLDPECSFRRKRNVKIEIKNDRSLIEYGDGRFYTFEFAA